MRFKFFNAHHSIFNFQFSGSSFHLLSLPFFFSDPKDLTSFISSHVSHVSRLTSSQHQTLQNSIHCSPNTNERQIHRTLNSFNITTLHHALLPVIFIPRLDFHRDSINSSNTSCCLSDATAPHVFKYTPRRSIHR